MRTTIGRALLASTTALALLVATATPASATPGTITAGTLTTDTVNPAETYDIGLVGPPPGGAPCPDAGAPTIGFTFITGQIIPGPFAKYQEQVPIGSGSWYWRNVSVVSGTFTISIPPGTITINILFQLSWHPITSATDCFIKTTAVCTVRTNMTLNGTWSGATAAPPGTAVVSGGPFNINRAGACAAAPFATRLPAIGPPFAKASISGLTFQF